MSSGTLRPFSAQKPVSQAYLTHTLTPLFYGRGPHHWDPRHVWPYKGIFFSRDPVATDALGAHLLATKRSLHFGKDMPITPAKHIRVAETRHHLGVADLKRIDLMKVGWEGDILI